MLPQDVNKVKRNDLIELAKKKRYNAKSVDWMEKHISDNAFALYKNCGNYIVMLENETREKKKLDVGFFCRQRLCSGCAWRAAVKSAQCVSSIAGALTEQGKVMVMATLTLPNVKGYDLNQTVKHLYLSYNKLMRREKYKAWGDNIRKLEITYNAKRNDYHPHLHILVFVPKRYFKSKQYISQKQLLSDWQSVTGQEEITQVDIRKTYGDDNVKAILEVSKYTAKASEYTQSEEVFDTMYEALYHTRLMTYAGKCKQLRDDYKNKKLVRFEELDATIYTMRVVYLWQRMADDYDYTEIKTENYVMSSAEIARAERDEERLQVLAMQKAKRMEDTKEWFAYQWVRDCEKATEELMTE